MWSELLPPSQSLTHPNDPYASIFLPCSFETTSIWTILDTGNQFLCRSDPTGSYLLRPFCYEDWSEWRENTRGRPRGRTDFGFPFPWTYTSISLVVVTDLSSGSPFPFYRTGHTFDGVRNKESRGKVQSWNLWHLSTSTDCLVRDGLNYKWGETDDPGILGPHTTRPFNSFESDHQQSPKRPDSLHLKIKYDPLEFRLISGSTPPMAESGCI